MNIPFEKSFASHEKAKYWSSINTENPMNVFKSSNKKFWFDCHVCNHNFEISSNKVVNRGQWCSYCSNKNLCHVDKCITCYNKSFASQEKSKFWSSKNIDKPRNVFKSSGNKYWFDCHVCNHLFETSLDKVVNRGQWCPYCSHTMLCDKLDCDFCYDNSFASHKKSKYWSNKNTEKPRNVFKSTTKKYWFDCIECKHSIYVDLNGINRGFWCSYCCKPPRKLCDNNCEFCYKKSFASHEKSKFWSSKNTENPRNVFKSSGKKYWFDCDICNNPFETQLDSVNNGRWCSKCKNKTERKMYNKLKEKYPEIIYQFKKEWCINQLSKTNKYLPFDFCIPEHKIIIELDGPQHFRQIMNWKTPEEQFENDKFKEECANNNGYSIIRLLQEDVMNDTYDWLKELCDAFEEIKSSNEFRNRRLCKNNEYNNF